MQIVSELNFLNKGPGLFEMILISILEMNPKWTPGTLCGNPDFHFVEPDQAIQNIVLSIYMLQFCSKRFDFLPPSTIVMSVC